MGLDEQQARSAGQFGKQAGNYGRGHILADTRDVTDLLERIGEKRGRALDVATGGGHTALALARAGFEVTAGDLAPAMLEQAERLLGEEGFRVKTALFPAEAFPFGDGEFSLVTCRVAAHHFSDVGAFVKESFRVLEEEGHLLVIDGSLPDDDRETAQWLHEVEVLRDPSHGRLLDRREWVGELEKAGFEVLWSELQPMAQPDLEWYFQTAGTPEANRAKVRERIATASPHVRAAMELVDAESPVRWTWQRVRLLGRKRRTEAG